MFLARAQQLGRLGDDEVGALASVMLEPTEVRAGEVIMREGEQPICSVTVLEGISARQKILPDSRRQILAFLIQGDGADLYSYPLKRLDHDVVALTSCLISRIPHERLDELIGRFPRLTITLWRETMLEAAILREHLVRLGLRTAPERMAHLFCELALRLTKAGYGECGKFNLRMSQSDLGDALGISTIHTNRSVKQLREAGLADFVRGRLTILDAAKLRSFAGFDSAYLQPPPLDAAGPLTASRG